MPEQDKREPHLLTLEARRELRISGVKHVDSFTENHIVLQTTMGTLDIRGKNLRIEQLDLDDGRFLAHGELDSLAYQQAGSRRDREKLWSRIWG
ncbi:MAG: sporulation protein YabP [Clostridia bacterium]